MNSEFSNLFNLKEVLLSNNLSKILAFQELEIDKIYLSVTDFPDLELFLKSSTKDLSDYFLILYEFQEDLEDFDFSSFSSKTQALATRVKKLTEKLIDLILELEENLDDFED